jgi:hypothetical protein
MRPTKAFEQNQQANRENLNLSGIRDLVIDGKLTLL